MKKFLKLYDIQRLLQNSISNFGDSPSTLELAEIIYDKPPISTSKRIGIYQDAYRIRLVESLRDDFSRIEERLGKRDFDKLAEEFVEELPSTFASLAEVSQKFPLFLKPLSEELYELASVSWIEILAGMTKRLDSERIATIQEIESGVPFRIMTNPNLHFFVGKNDISISYCDSNDVFVKSVFLWELEILKMLKEPMTTEELSNALEKTSFNLENVQSVISSWIKNEILLCERISYVQKNS